MILKCAVAAIACWALAFPVRAQAPEMPLYSVEQLRGDLDLIWTAASEGDPAVDRYRSRQELAGVFAAARGRIDRPMSELEFYRIAAPAVASLGNGHSQLSLSGSVRAWLTQSAPLLPLGTRVVDGKLYVIRDFSAEGAVPPGAQILSINGRSARELLEATIAAMSLDGRTRAPRENGAGGWRLLYDLVRLHGLGPSYSVSYRADGRRRTVEVAGRPGSAIVRDWRQAFPDDVEAAQGPAPSGLVIEPGLAILKIAHWDHPHEGGPGMAEQMQAWIEEIVAAGAPALAIDLRNNGGGNEILASQLLSYLTDAPFRYYACLTINAADFSFFRYVANAEELRAEIPLYTRPASGECRSHGALEMTEAAFSNLGLQSPREPHFGGRVYLIVNSNSFSTSAEFASMFAALNIGLIVGQETSGGYLGDSSGLEAAVTLPATGMTFAATLIAYHMARPRLRGTQGGVRPDIVIRPTVADLIAGRDLELEEVRRCERRLR